MNNKCHPDQASLQRRIRAPLVETKLPKACPTIDPKCLNYASLVLHGCLETVLRTPSLSYENGLNESEWDKFFGKRPLGHIPFSPDGLSPVTALTNIGR